MTAMTCSSDRRAKDGVWGALPTWHNDRKHVRQPQIGSAQTGGGKREEGGGRIGHATPLPKREMVWCGSNANRVLVTLLRILSHADLQGGDL